MNIHQIHYSINYDKLYIGENSKHHAKQPILLLCMIWNIIAWEDKSDNKQNQLVWGNRLN